MNNRFGISGRRDRFPQFGIIRSEVLQHYQRLHIRSVFDADSPLGCPSADEELVVGQLPDGEQVTRIDRLRLGSGEPLMLEDILIACDLCPGLHLKDLANVPLNDIITPDYRVPLIRAVESIEPSIADDYTRKLLEMSSPALILLVEHTTFTVDDRPVLFVRSRYRGDRYKFSIELTGDRVNPNPI